MLAAEEDSSSIVLIRPESVRLSSTQRPSDAVAGMVNYVTPLGSAISYAGDSQIPHRRFLADPFDFGYPVAYLYTQVAPRRRAAVLSAVLAPLLTSALVRTFGWMVILGNDGVVNAFLRAAGVIDMPIHFLFRLNGVVIGMTQVLLPFMIVPLIPALQTIPPHLEEAALNLGASKWQTLWRVTVPLSMPGIAAGVSLVFVLAFTEFTVSILMGGGTFAVISVQLFQTMTTLLDWSKGAALATMLLAQSALYVFLLQWILHPRPTAGCRSSYLLRLHLHD